MSDSTPTRIAFCITDLDPGGAERALVQIVSRLDRQRWEPRVYCLSGPGSLVDELEQREIPVTCLGATRAWQVWILRRLAACLKDFQPELLQTFLFHGNLLGRLAGRWAKVPHIIAGIRVAEKRSLLPLRLDRWTNSLVQCNICVSQAVADFTVNQGKLPREKVIVIPNGVDVERFQQAVPADLTALGIPADAKTALFVGRLDPQKSPATLLDAAGLLLDEFPELHVLFVGDGPLRDQLAADIARHQWEHRIHFAGWRPNVPEIMRACDCLVLPSEWEGMPNVVLEAMAAGLPVVASDVEGVRELLDHQQSGLIIPPHSAPLLAEALRQILSQPEAAAAMACKAQTIADKEFTWDHITSQYETAYRQLREKSA